LGISISLSKTPLHYAATNGNINVVKYLLSKNCLREEKDDENHTPKDLAQDNGYLDIVSLLSSSPVAPQKEKVSKCCAIL